ncbi:MAG: VWA domain-containing protein, partial [Phycisphaeraceae bacterium]|nr:VWA domain-containing protein [Phycisphaeraceae bacterium]
NDPKAGTATLFYSAPSEDDDAAEETRGRDDERSRRRDRHYGRCWWPPEADLPNGEPYDAMFFEHYGVNPFIITEEDAQSTFAIDVDNASYTIARRYINDGNLPPEEAIRVEEFVNYFDQGYSAVDDGDFAIRLDGAPSPFADGYHLLRVSMQGREVTPRERKAANLIFVIDTSGSMGRENRLGLVKRALGVLLNELDEADTVGIVEYGSRGRIVLHPTSVE